MRDFFLFVISKQNKSTDLVLNPPHCKGIKEWSSITQLYETFSSCLNKKEKKKLKKSVPTNERHKGVWVCKSHSIVAKRGKKNK